MIDLIREGAADTMQWLLHLLGKGLVWAIALAVTLAVIVVVVLIVRLILSSRRVHVPPPAAAAAGAPAPAPVPVAVPRVGVFVTYIAPWLFSKILLGGLLVVALVLLVGWVFQTGTIVWDTVPFWLQLLAGIVGVLALLALLKYVFGGVSISAGLPKKGGFFAQVLVYFLVFALVLYALYGVSPNAKLFTTAEGWTTIAVYCVAMMAVALAAINFKGLVKVTPWIGMFIFFWFTGVHSWHLLNSDGVFEQRTHIASTISS